MIRVLTVVHGKRLVFINYSSHLQIFSVQTISMTHSFIVFVLQIAFKFVIHSIYVTLSSKEKIKSRRRCQSILIDIMSVIYVLAQYHLNYHTFIHWIIVIIKSIPRLMVHLHNSYLCKYEGRVIPQVNIWSDNIVKTQRFKEQNA